MWILYQVGTVQVRAMHSWWFFFNLILAFVIDNTDIQMSQCPPYKSVLTHFFAYAYEAGGRAVATQMSKIKKTSGTTACAFGICTSQPCIIELFNALKKTEHFLPRYLLLVLYRAYVLPTLAYSNLLENVQTAAAKLILGCLRTASHEIILKELLFVRHQVHILIAFRTTLFDHNLPSYPPLLPNCLKIFRTTLHVPI